MPFRQLSVELLIISAIGLVLGMLGPFGTYTIPLAFRLLYWTGFILVGYAIFRPVTHAASWLTQITVVPLWAAIILATAVAALPLAFLIGFAMNGMRVAGPLLGSDFAALYLQCAGIGIAIFLLMRLVFPRSSEDQPGHDVPDKWPQKQSEAQQMETAQPSQQAKLHNRLPPGFPDEIFALHIEDHYVRVHAAQRSEMLLMRFSDAIDEMDMIEGMQVHRSWWVAKAAVTGVKRQGRNVKLVLSNNMEIPVSRSHIARLKQSGWIS